MPEQSAGSLRDYDHSRYPWLLGGSSVQQLFLQALFRSGIRQVQDRWTEHDIACGSAELDDVSLPLIVILFDFHGWDRGSWIRV
jgi:hypothetical protein